MYPWQAAALECGFDGATWSTARPPPAASPWSRRCSCSARSWPAQPAAALPRQQVRMHEGLLAPATLTRMPWTAHGRTACGLTCEAC